MKLLGLIWGVLLILLGGVLLAWIAYNQFVEMHPAAAGKNPHVPTAFALALLGVGGSRLLRQFKSRSVRGDDHAA